MKKSAILEAINLILFHAHAQVIDTQSSLDCKNNVKFAKSCYTPVKEDLRCANYVNVKRENLAVAVPEAKKYVDHCLNLWSVAMVVFGYNKLTKQRLARLRKALFVTLKYEDGKLKIVHD